jgi:hypothetical protein
MSEDENLGNRLFDTPFLDRLAVASREGIDLGADQEFADDLNTLGYAGLYAKYGPDVAQNAWRTQFSGGEAQRAEDESVSLSRGLADAGLSLAGGFTGLAGNIVGQALSVPIGAVRGALDDDITVREGIRQQSAATIESTERATSFIDSFTSDETQMDRYWMQLEREAIRQGNEFQMERRIEEGGSPLMENFRRIGEDFLEIGAATLSDPTSMRDLVAQGIGSLGPSAAIARGSQMLAARGMARLGAGQRAQSIAGIAAASAAIGATESSEAYVGAVREVMEAPEELLLESSVYQGLLAEGYEPDEARLALATMTGQQAFLTQLPAALSLGMLARRFETAPIGTFREGGIVDGFRTILSQTAEEAGQEAGSAFAIGSSIRRNVDPERDVSGAIGEAAALGALGGFGMSGAIGAATAATSNARSAYDRGVETVTEFRDSDGPARTAEAVRDLAGTATQAVSNVIEDRTRPADARRRTESSQATEPLREFAQSLRETNDVVSQEEAVSNDNVARIVEAGADAIDVLNSRQIVSDQDIPTLAVTINELERVRDVLPDEQQFQVDKVLESPEIRKIQERAKNVDLNEIMDDNVELTTEIVQSTVSVAAINPANVNPNVVNRLLEQSGDLFSDAQIRYLEGASRIATAVNDHKNRQVQIIQDRDISLERINEKTPKGARSQSDVSRSIRVAGYKGKKSVNDFAADIMSAAQGNGTVREGGGTGRQVDIPVERTIRQFGNLIQHLNNKVTALNESLAQNNEKGLGPSVGFRGLATAERWFEASQNKSPVSYHSSRPGSVAFAQDVKNDLDVAVQVFNELRSMFPEAFGSIPEVTAVELAQPTQQTQREDIDVDALNAEIDAQEAAEQASVESQRGRRLRRDAVLKAEESLIENEPSETIDEVSPRETEEQNQNEEDSSGNSNTDDTDSNVDSGQDTSEQDQSQTIEDSDESFEDELNAEQSEADNEDEGGFDEAELVDAVEPDNAIDIQNLHETMDTAYQETGAPEFTGVDTFIEVAEARGVNPETVRMNKRLVKPLVKALNKRLTNIGLKKLTKPEAAFYRNLRVTALMDRETQQYNQELVELAGIAFVDWLMTVRTNNPSLTDAAEDLGLSLADIDSDEQIEAIMNGVPPARAKREIADRILQMWNMRRNVDRPIAETDGIVEGLAAEMIMTMAENPRVSLIRLADLPTMVDGKMQTATTIRVDGLEELQKQARMARTDDNRTITSAEVLFDEDAEMYSIGTKIPYVARQQTRSGVELSDLERAALKKMQDTPHYADEGKVNLMDALGQDLIMKLLGYREDAEDIPNKVLRASVAGRNLGIEKDVLNAAEIINVLGSKENPGSVPVYYPVGVSKVGRHQYQGINPQANKLLRMLVTPTWSEISFADPEAMDAFWLGVAQATGVKVEKKNQAQVLDTIRDEFNAEYGTAAQIIYDWLQGNDLDGNALINALGTGIEPQLLSAVYAVAEMQFNKDAGNESFRTSLSFELDGLTNGAANMMVNYGQGELTENDRKNLNRVGLFLGRPNTTINDYFSVGNKDLYEVVAEESEKYIQRKLMQYRSGIKPNPDKAAQMESALRFAGYFGTDIGFSYDEKTGTSGLGRNAAKNPMTKVNYGSGVSGVGTGIADDIALELYTKLQNMPEGTDLRQYFGYPDIYTDMWILFEYKPTKVGPSFTLDNNAMSTFRRNISQTLGTALAETTKNIIGDKITELNDMLVFSTNVQARYVKMMFEQRINELAEKRATEGKIGRNKKGDPIKAELSRRDYMNVVKEMEKLSPIFRSDDQTLAIGGFERQRTDMLVSATLDDKLRQEIELPAPDDVGVRAIPYSVIGSGDAMMMNLIFGSDGAPNDVLGIFDGLDVPVSKVKEYAPYVNQQVMRSWERDVLAMAVQNFEGFLSQVSDDAILLQAFQDAKDANKKTTVFANDSKELLQQLQQRHLENKARKSVLKSVPVSVDQMGGSNVGWTRDGDPVSINEINDMIQRELEGRAVQEQQEVNVEVLETTALAALEGIKMNENQRKVANILKPMLGETRVIVGSRDQLNEWRRLNVPDSVDTIRDVKGVYDVQNNIIFLTTNNVETMLHEMVHAGTFNQVLDHYQGNTNDAVTRLEALMEQFLELESDGQNINEAKAAILTRRGDLSPESQAAALNEFMAYSLTNAQIGKRLRSTEARGIQKLAQQVLALMKRLMGGIPTDMFNQVVFNTTVLNQTTVDQGDNGDNGGGDGDNSDGENTPPFEEHTNRWIQTIKEYIDEYKKKNIALKISGDPLRDLTNNANRSIESLRQVGMLRNDTARRTFKAIYMIMGTEMKLDPNTVIALTRVFEHIEEQMTPEMFGSHAEANQEYSAVINAFGQYKNGDISDALNVLLALSQTSEKFRKVLEQIPDAEGQDQIDGALNTFLTRVSANLMQKITGSINIQDKNIASLMDDLASGLLEVDREREYAVMRSVTQTLDKADSIVSGVINRVSDRVNEKNREVQASTRSQLVKSLAATVTTITNLGSKQRSAVAGEVVKGVTHMNTFVPIPVKELVSEFMGTDRFNKDFVAMYDQVNYRISGMRQAYREDLPGILQNQFNVPPNEEQWASMHFVLGQSDLTRFIDPRKMQQGMAYLEESSRRRKRIRELEAAIEQYTVPYVATDARNKAQQLANFMMGKGAGNLLMRNAYAIVKNLDGNFEPNLVPIVDELVTMYVIDQMDPDVRETTVQLWQNETPAMQAMIAYIQGLNEAEDNKAGISEQARLNSYKGYIPDIAAGDTRIVVQPDSMEDDLAGRGYKRVKPFTGDVGNSTAMSYYVTNVRQGGLYSQGIMQNVAATYRGVDINTGMSVTDQTSSELISDDAVVEQLIKDMNDPTFSYLDDKEVLMPVFDEDGTVLGFERSINPDVMNLHLKRDHNFAVMMGAWAGRQVEESLAYEYNKSLIDELDSIWRERETGTEDMFVNIKSSKDPIYRESFRLWPQSIKLYADGKFDGNGPMIRQDQLNLSTGYREASVADFWSGKTRLPKPLQKATRDVSQLLLGQRAMSILTTGENLLQGAVSTAKDIIVIRSLIVPLANTRSNVIQLNTIGIPTKSIVDGYRKKLAEVEEYNKNVTKRIRLEAELRLNRNNPNRRRVLEDRIKVIDDLNSRMTIAPMIEAGAYKNLSEGITDLDVDITRGRIGDYTEALANKLPDSVANIAKIGIVAKSTKMYQIANRATQYGDFLAKSILYDHLIAQGETEADAVRIMNEEFVNFSYLPGRFRSMMESNGLFWFMAFKIRIAKIAMKQLRDNPVRAIGMNQLLPDIGSPLQDNIFTVTGEGRLDYATGYEMLFDAPGLNPWINLLDG